ncbi:transglycosylase domain-containing protein [Nocardiopsis chromatogenes]|uniref:transglycosylase domain-containing protein n=1 Tax=Nocardiopsis chromatogenes TaxID=280239 RepID=UPI00034BFC72
MPVDAEAGDVPESDESASRESENGGPGESEAGEAPVSDDDSDGKGADAGDADEAEGVGAFKDSGSFFRDRVAKTLAEQGFSLRSDGTWDNDASAASGDDSADGAPADDAPADDAPAEGTASPGGDDGGGPAEEDEEQDRPASSDASEASSAPSGSPDAWDPESTAAFAPVFGADDETAEEPDAGPDEESGKEPEGEKGSVAEDDGDSWDPESTSAFTPVFEDDGADTTADDASGDSAGGTAGSADGKADTTAESGDTAEDDSSGSAAAAAAAVGGAAASLAGGAGSEGASEAASEAAPKGEGKPVYAIPTPPPAPAGAPTPSPPSTSASSDSSSDTPAESAASTAASGGAVGGAAGAASGGASGGSAGGADEAPVTGARNLLRAKVPGKGKGAPGAAAAGEASTASAAASGGPGKGRKGPKGPKGPTGPGKGKKPKKPMWFRATRALLITAGVFMLLGIGGFAVAYASFEVPTAAKAEATDQGSIFYYADGETKFAERGVDRDPVSFDEIPEHVQEAVISAEDRGFWTEPGVSVSGTVRGAWSTFTGQQVQGGSTITQQMVRNYFEGVSKDQTISRKLKEMIIALKIDRSDEYDKQWVMEQYLNTIYFGRNAYGIQAAAQAYYHKDVGDLTPDEAAFLAAAIQQPTKFGMADSDTTPEMEKRWKYVVNGLVSEEIITPSDADGMEFPKPEESRPTEGMDLSGYKGYMLQQAMSELEGLGYTEDNINRNGYKIVTTFDKDLMDAAVDAVETNVDVDNLPDGVYAGLTAIDPATGEVVAFYGGKDYNENQYDSAFRGSAQAGSAFKPYVLAAALESGKSLNTIVDGTSGQSFNGSVVNNSHPGGGPQNLIDATRESSNTGFINLALETGLPKVVDMAHAAGIPENKITEQQAAAPTLALGVSDVSAVDQASGFATFANGGVHIEPHVVREIVDVNGENLREKPAENRAMKEGVAADVTYALQQVVTSGTGTSAQLPDRRPVAGKTGTTDSSVAGWFAGYTPQMSTAVGVYNGNNQPFLLPGVGEVYGGNVPASIWRTFMAEAMADEDPEPFPSPSYGGQTENYAPDVPTQDPGGDQEPQEPQQPQEPQEPQQPEQPQEPEVPADPGPTDPGGGETPPDGGGDQPPDGGGGGETPPEGGGGGDDGTFFP